MSTTEQKKVEPDQVDSAHPATPADEYATAPSVVAVARFAADADLEGTVSSAEAEDDEPILDDGASENGNDANGGALAEGIQNVPAVERTRDADVEARGERARDFVEDLLNKMGMNAEAELLEPEPDDPPAEVRIEIEGPDSGRIIGKKGQVLAAIQHVINRVVNRPNLERLHVIVDAEGYRQRREDSLASMAQRLGKRALEEGKIITFEPMCPRDRRIVHLALAKFPGVVTKSDGEGEGRRVQIIPVRR